jgi:hypothetical protein
MPDLGDLLDDEASRVRGGPGALDAVLRRAGRRRRTRRIASGVLALALAGGAFGLAYAAFRPSGRPTPAGRPIPGPSVTPTSDDATPPPLRLRLLNGARVETLANSTALRLESEAPLERGYLVVEHGFAQTHRAVTGIFCPPYLDVEAERLRDWLFPGAEIHGAIPNDRYELTVILGEDYAARNERQTAAYALFTDFLDRRAIGSGAEELLSPDAAALFRQRYGGLSLYGYTTQPGTEVALVGLIRETAGYRAIVRISREGSNRLRYEQLRVEPGPEGASNYPENLLIVYAERNQ